MYWIPIRIKTLVTIRYALIHIKTSLLVDFYCCFAEVQKYLRIIIIRFRSEHAFSKVLKPANLNSSKSLLNVSLSKNNSSLLLVQIYTWRESCMPESKHE